MAMTIAIIFTYCHSYNYHYNHNIRKLGFQVVSVFTVKATRLAAESLPIAYNGRCSDALSRHFPAPFNNTEDESFQTREDHGSILPKLTWLRTEITKDSRIYPTSQARLQKKRESWNMTVLQPQSLEKKENQHKSSQAHIPIFVEAIVQRLRPLSIA